MDNSSTSRPRSGLIAAFARHPTAPNILLLIMVALGIASLDRLNRQFFPDYSIDYVNVGVAWPGASAEEVEQSVLVAIEPEVRFLDSVKRVTATAQEGYCGIVIEFREGTDMQKALADVETAVAGVTTLPETTERPTITRIIPFEQVARIRVAGPYDEAQLRSYAKVLRDGLLAAGADKVTISDLRSPELVVDVEPAALLALDLSLNDVAGRIAAHSRDVPGGDTHGAAELQVRMLGERATAREMAALEIVSDSTGRTFRVDDLATVSDTFAAGMTSGRVDGRIALSLRVSRSPASDILEIWDDVQTYLNGDLEGLPDDLELTLYRIEADGVVSRLDMLVRNGLGGLALVLIILFMFLSPRTAFWVAVGIPAAFAATLFAMYLSGQSINMISMFAMIMMLGIVVDDAIVVAEHGQMQWERGVSSLDASVMGARAMLWPVLAASVTTACAFMPIFFMTGLVGQIVGAIPFVVVAVLLASLFECFLVLPGHLRHAFGGKSTGPREARGFRRWFDRGFTALRDGIYRRFVAWALTRRYLMVAIVVASFLAVGGLLAGGKVKFVFFPQLEANVAEATFWFPAGTPRSTTEAMVDELERAAHAVDDAGYIETTYGFVGRPSLESRMSGAGLSGDHVGGMILQLIPIEDRTIQLQQVMDAWRAEVRPLPGLENLVIAPPPRGPPGKEFDIRLSGAGPEALKAAALDTRALLAGYVGVTDIRDDFPYGKRELALTLTQRGRALGFTTASVAREVRGAFQGIIAQRLAAGDEELVVRVRMRPDAMEAHALKTLFVRSPAGLQVPLSEVVDIEEQQGFSVFRRENGVREVAVTANVDASRANANEVLAQLADGALADAVSPHGVRWRLAGRSEEQQDTLREMQLGAVLGLLAIYLTIALVFGSYTRPIIVMVVIPFATVGAILGHWVMGHDLTIISLLGLLGLSGIVVNGSIIVVNTIDRHMRTGDDLLEAVVNGSCERFRAVILTTASTIGGLAPLLLETSFQAQFIQPMVVTIIFGLLATTPLVLVIVPSLFLVQNDVGQLIRWLLTVARIRGRTSPAP
ncbi:MAG: efflux RND transporter permease subunit [Rhodospirillales bacterium]|nr:efflux RND transporter permease subunit [Rhodospirillales bacterium]